MKTVHSNEYVSDDYCEYQRMNCHQNMINLNCLVLEHLDMNVARCIDISYSCVEGCISGYFAVVLVRCL